MKRTRTTPTAICLTGYAAAALTLAACGASEDAGSGASAAPASTSITVASTTPETQQVGADEDADEAADAVAEATDAVTTEPGTPTDDPPATDAPSATEPTTVASTAQPLEGSEPTAGDADVTSVGQRLRDAAATTLALTSFEATVIADQETPTRTDNLVGNASFDYDAFVGSVEFTIVQSDTTDSIAIVANGDSFWMRVLDRDLEALPEGRSWITGPASLLRADSAQFEPANTLGVLAGLFVVDDAEELGSGTSADGAPVERFRATVDYDAAYDADARRASMYFPDLRGTDGIMVIDVAIDRDGVVREFSAVASSQRAPDVRANYVLSVSSPGGSIAVPEPPDPTLVATGPEADELRARFFE